MAWSVNAHNLTMAEGDWGISIPLTVRGVTFSAHDEMELTIKTAVNGTVLVDKVFTGITDNTVNFVLTEAESALLPVGQYVYLLDWYQNGAFMCNIIPSATLRVVEKA